MAPIREYWQFFMAFWKITDQLKKYMIGVRELSFDEHNKTVVYMEDDKVEDRDSWFVLDSKGLELYYQKLLHIRYLSNITQITE